jgi:Tfp pilus assembly protein PilN
MPQLETLPIELSTLQESIETFQQDIETFFTEVQRQEDLCKDYAHSPTVMKQL